MSTIRVLNLGGLNLFLNPLLKKEGELIRAVNVNSYPHGAKSKRPGLTTYLGTADGSTVTNLFSWQKNDGTTLYTYRVSGTQIYYSTQGTGAWTACGNGDVTAGNYVGHAVLDDTLIVCDGAGSTKHTTNGTSFTDTTLAPVAVDLAQFQNRIYACGTSSTLFWSSAGDATDWNTSGTSDSSSIEIPGAGKLLSNYVVNDKLIVTKNSGIMHKWDGFNRIDMATDLGPTSPWSVQSVEGFFFWLNREGIYGFGGLKPQLLSNSIQPQIYNDAGSAIAGATFDTAPSVIHRYDYMVAVGTITDDYTDETINDAVIKYNFQKNEFLNYKFAVDPTAMHSFKDTSGVQTMIMGDSSGQCYQLSGTATSDNGTAIETVQEYVIDFGRPDLEKEWKWIQGFFNPGCQAQVQVAVGDSYDKEEKNWMEVGDCSTGVCETRLPDGSMGRFLFARIYENSTDPGFSFYGFSINADIQGPR